ncbi:MAG TPA: hypothetical protein VH413_09845 [Verrucomicrobiae bacterium]|jgi:hypothetical protein|nr:hypothetical protein [Verrucomicrobiae bacterium]
MNMRLFSKRNVPETLIGRIWKSPLDRMSYFWWGVILMAVKYNLDRLIAKTLFGRSWYIWNYFKPSDFANIGSIPPDDQGFYLVLLVTALPFLFLGTVLTVCRLRSAGLPLPLFLFFFVPIINLSFFALLCVMPAKESVSVLLEEPVSRRWLPVSAVGSAVFSTVVVGLIGVALVFLSTEGLGSYGWGLFVALPFTMGLVSVLLYAGRQHRSLNSCLAVSVLPILFCAIGLLFIAVEGVICIVMAAPIAVVLAIFGGLLGFMIVGIRHKGAHPAVTLLILLAVPFTMGMEQRAGDKLPMLFVTSSVVINAPPEKVWPNVISFSPIPPQRDWVLHSGVAYPTQARIDGQGVGAIRHCIFTTGEFLEPIEVWDQPHRLRFSVADQPEPLEELSPYGHLDAPHLHGYLESHEGELRLIALPGGKTRLEGTTWYTDRISPTPYWQIWSDMLIHHIHLRVLNHIKALSEQTAGNFTPSPSQPS